MKTTKLFLYTLLLIASALSFEACKKEDNVNPSGTGTYKYDYRDTMYANIQNLYLWFDKLPAAADFKPQSYLASDPSQMIAKVRTYSPLNSQNQNVDRWSFVITRAEYEAEQQGQVTGLFGFSRGFVSDTDLRVAYVLPNSPFDQAGVTRGWRIMSVNGVSATSANVTALNTEFGKSSGKFVFQDTAGNQKELTIARADFTTSPVQHRSIQKVDGKNVGYIVFSEFTEKGKQDLTNAFSYFQQNGGIQELVIDLRYNGGGDPNVAAHFANQFVPTSADGKVFYTYQFNSKNTQRNSTVRVSKSGSLSLSRVFFITTQGSASASELLINGVKPFMQTILVGDRTHGKPVGMLGFYVDKYIPFAISFKTVNANGEGDYFDGLPAQKQQVDDLTRNFGDPAEKCLADVLYYVKNGVLPATQNQRLATQVVEANERLSQEHTRTDMTVIQK